MDIEINLKEHAYHIITGRNILQDINSYYDFSSKKVLVVSDDNIPFRYLEALKKVISFTYLILPHGEKTKDITHFLEIQNQLLEQEFSRKDVIIALGGGVISDLVGFVASTYKRGIDFINIPTSTLAMIDASIGGKTAIDFQGVKNIIGTFYQPKLVLIDFDLLSSLPIRQFNNGLVEALKASYIYDPTILDLFENIPQNLEEIIIRSIKVKKYFVENDEKETSIRKILNFGHTFGHGFESYFALSNTLYHGEAVGIGMLLLVKDKEKMLTYLQKLDISLNEDYDENQIIEFIKNDKKKTNNTISLILVDHIGEAYIKETTFDELKNILQGGKEYVRRLRK
jgi:3-dehydroquinate synthase